jgi:poly(3-hydroxybutyrate) depolymerase
MCRWVTIWILLAVAATAGAQEEYVLTIPTTLADTTETFWLQIPAGYEPGRPCPLLVGWHSLGGNHLEMRSATTFDSIANARGWIATSHSGPIATHWNNHAAQSHVVDVIRWIEERYTVDPDRIYMVGASMGGAGGMVFANNHLDPDGPRVAAAASLSGIQDCERRFREQGWNDSMYGAFGGAPEEVPYEYHHNSAICFADSTQSMHYNARHLPLFLTFGSGVSDSVWRSHAEDLYAVLHGWADSVVLRESSQSGHGWSCGEEKEICDFLGAFRLQRAPLALSINADEGGRWSWTDLTFRNPDSSFARLEVVAEPAAARLQCVMVRNVAAVVLDLPAIDFRLAEGRIVCRGAVRDPGPAELGLRGVPVGPTLITRDGVPYDAWTYDPLELLLTLTVTEDACYTISFDASAVAEPPTLTRGERLRVRWDAGPGELVCWPGSRGTLDWAVYDALGRRIWAGACATLGEREIVRVTLPRWVPSGMYVAALDRRGEAPDRAVCRFIRLR